MMTIEDIAIDPRIGDVSFACDVCACRGACCCTSGVRGAPLENDEVAAIERAYPAAAKYLSEEHLAVIREHGLTQGTPGDFTTTCVGDRQCVFVAYEGPNARCAIEKAFENGETNWRKPLSCHLFPLRVRQGRMEDLLSYEEFPECAPAVERGGREGIPLVDFVREALIRRFGPRWVEQLEGRLRGQT